MDSPPPIEPMGVFQQEPHISSEEWVQHCDLPLTDQAHVCVCAETVLPWCHPAHPPHTHIIHPELFYVYGDAASTAGILQSAVIS